MNITVEKCNNDIYPYIGIHASGTIVYFISYGRGICLEKGASTWDAGDFANDWNMNTFTKFKGKITLEN